MPLGRTPLDKWLVHRRDLYLTTNNTHKRQTFMPPAGFEPAIPASERPPESAWNPHKSHILLLHIRLHQTFIPETAQFPLRACRSKIGTVGEKDSSSPPHPNTHRQIFQLQTSYIKCSRTATTNPFTFYSLSRKIKVLVTLCREISNSVTRPGRRPS